MSRPLRTYTRTSAEPSRATLGKQKMKVGTSSNIAPKQAEHHVTSRRPGPGVACAHMALAERCQSCAIQPTKTMVCCNAASGPILWASAPALFNDSEETGQRGISESCAPSTGLLGSDTNTLISTSDVGGPNPDFRRCSRRMDMRARFHRGDLSAPLNDTSHTHPNAEPLKYPIQKIGMSAYEASRARARI